MEQKEYYFTCLNEEAGEVIQASCKCQRFGELDGYPNTERTNISDLIRELNDVLAVVELLQEEGVVFDGLYDRKQIEAKKERVKKWLQYSIKMGTLSEPILINNNEQILKSQITLEEARKSYADFMKIDEKILMPLHEDESVFYFLHCKKDTCWKTSVSKKERDLFRALNSLTEKEIESYDKWLIKQAV